MKVSGHTIKVRGQVQGVGFRPFVWRLANRFGLKGDVVNDAEGVRIRVAGGRIDAFLACLESEAPPLARIDEIEVSETSHEPFESFVIGRSGFEGADVQVTPDAATCAECIAEIRGSGRRKGYAFTNCTACGPRFSIIKAAPYDRANTTMAGFEMCAACRSEYEDPHDRRFHAQPIACPDCGPALRVSTGDPDPLGRIAKLLEDGGIVAIKGLGGYHLSCLATDPVAIAELRARKHRPSKPLALMGTLRMIEQHADLSSAEAALLKDPAAPILLLTRASAELPEELAPGMSTLGWMLPHTPLQHLLLERVARPLVMTSGNIAGEPQIFSDDEAAEKLGALADEILSNDRDIVRRQDDSVERVVPSGRITLRRGRGRAPQSFPLPESFAQAPSVIAHGGQMKATVCLTQNGRALLSHHIGDLDSARALADYETACLDYLALFACEPTVAVHDLHPGYRSTEYALRSGLPCIGVQHHHAHLAACLAENRWDRAAGPVGGIVLDGLGFGPDGTIWGGELLVGDYSTFRRAAWLKPAPLPGGDAANREPWRNLLVRLDQSGRSAAADRYLSGKPVKLLRQSVTAGVNAPVSSSAGRLFDAAAAALGLIGDHQTYEGEAAMQLEACAERSSLRCAEPWPVSDGEIDPALFFKRWADDDDCPEDLAALFHASLAASFANEARRLYKAGEIRAVALSGGCLQNALLLTMLLEALDGLPVLTHSHVPPNDGGLALGQAAIALAKLLE